MQSISEGKDDLPPTYGIDKNTWQDKVKHVEQRPSPDPTHCEIGLNSGRQFLHLVECSIVFYNTVTVWKSSYS